MLSSTRSVHPSLHFFNHRKVLVKVNRCQARYGPKSRRLLGKLVLPNFQCSAGPTGFTESQPSIPGSIKPCTANIRTIYQTKWSSVEMIGTLTGSRAEVATRLAVHQEFYHRRSRLLLLLVKHLARSTPENLPFTETKLRKIKELDEKGSVGVVLSVLQLPDWIALAVRLLGSNATWKIVASAIESAELEAKQLLGGKTTRTVADTVSICTEEFLSVVKRHDKDFGREENDNGANGSEEELEADSELAEEPAKEVGLTFRQDIYRRVAEGLVDGVVEHAENMEDIEIPTVSEYPTAAVKILGTKFDSMDIKTAVRSAGPGVQQLRQQMSDHRNVTHYIDGIHDPFEGTLQKDMFSSAPWVFQQHITNPVPEIAWFSARVHEEGGSETDTVEQSTGGKVLDAVGGSEEVVEKLQVYKGFKSSSEISAVKDREWRVVKIVPDELIGLIFGLSEYICDDFQIKSSSGGDGRCYPHDGPVRVCSRNGATVLEMSTENGEVSVEMDAEMMHALQNLCDEVIRNVPDFVRLSAPVPRATGPGFVRKTLKLGFRVLAVGTVVLMGWWAGMRSGVLRRAKMEGLLPGRGSQTVVVRNLVEESNAEKADK